MQTLCKSFFMSEEFDGSLGHNLEMKSESVSPGHVQDGQPGLLMGIKLGSLCGVII